MKITLRDGWYSGSSEESDDASAFVEEDDGRVRLYIMSDSKELVSLDERAIHELAKLVAVAEETIDQLLEDGE
jgi:hypothetical protein